MLNVFEQRKIHKSIYETSIIIIGKSISVFRINKSNQRNSLAKAETANHEQVAIFVFAICGSFKLVRLF